MLVFHVFELADIHVAKWVSQALGDKWTDDEPECKTCMDMGRLGGDIPCPNCNVEGK